MPTETRTVTPEQQLAIEKLMARRDAISDLMARTISVFIAEQQAVRETELNWWREVLLHDDVDRCDWCYDVNTGTIGRKDATDGK